MRPEFIATDEIRRLSERLEEDRLHALDCYSPCDQQLLVQPEDLDIDAFSRSEAVGLVRALVSRFGTAVEEIGKRP